MHFAAEQMLIMTTCSRFFHLRFLNTSVNLITLNIDYMPETNLHSVFLTR